MDGKVVADIEMYTLGRLLDMARNHLATGRFAAVQNICDQVLVRNPEHCEACYLLAKVHGAEGDYTAAAASIIKIRVPVEDEQILSDYYRFHQKSNNLSQAVSYLRCCVQAFPGSYHAWYYLALSLSACGINDHFLQAALRAARLCESVAQRHYDLARIYEAGCLATLAEQQLRSGLAVASQDASMLNGLGNVLKMAGRAREADSWYRTIVDELEIESYPGFYSNFLMNLICVADLDPATICMEHTRWAEKMCPVTQKKPGDFRNALSSGRVLRVGYVSSDFYSHPVAFFIEPLLTLHDYSRFEIFIYANVESEDYVTEQFKQRPCSWRSIYRDDDETVCRMVEDDAIDILVDLGGHTRRNRLTVFARKPAPIQVTWLGYANTTGLAAIDYRFSDAVADPPGMTEHLHSEQLYRLPGCFINYHPPLHPPDVEPLPCLKNGFITFAAFNNLAKVNQPLLEQWSEILKQTPGSILVLKDKLFGADLELKREWLDHFACQGITADRVRIIGNPGTVHDYLTLFSQHDIALDAYPYTGTTTTCESLWMGVPVVTLAGPTHVTRVSASILTNIGVSELIAESPEQYISLAIELANDQNRLQQYRRKLRSMMQESSLMDCEGFARKMEAAYRDIWQRWCQQRSCGKSVE